MMQLYQPIVYNSHLPNFHGLFYPKYKTEHTWGFLRTFPYLTSAVHGVHLMVCRNIVLYIIISFIFSV
jgi:hypothetical protein